MTDLTPETIARLRELDAARTQGEWRFSNASDRRGRKGEFRAPSPHNGFMLVGPWTNDSDAEFIAAAANAMPGLLDAADERDRLSRWKDEALPVIDGLQELGRALGLPLGSRITGPDALSAVERLAAEVTRFRAELAEARAAIERVRLLADKWESPTQTWCDGREACVVGAAHLPSQLRAALADPEAGES